MYYFPSTREMKEMKQIIFEFKCPALYLLFHFNDVELTLEQHDGWGGVRGTNPPAQSKIHI